MNLFDQAVLLATGLVAIYLIVRFVQDCRQQGKYSLHNIYYIISFAVLLVAGLLLIIFSYDVLARPCVVIVAALIPFALSLGLITEFYNNLSKGYLIFVIVGLIAIGVTRFTGAAGLATFSLAFFHSIAGLVIFFIPILLVKAGKVPGGFIMVTVGGTLIGIGGIALAFLKAGAPILSADIIFTILAPILLLMALAFSWGFVKKIAAEK